LPRSHILRHVRHPSLGLPRRPTIQSHLSMWLRVAPHPTSSGFAGHGSSSCLESRILQHIQRTSSELPRSFALLVAPDDEFPGCPGLCIFRLYRRRTFESPRISRPSALPALALWVSPRHLRPVAPPSVVAGFPAPCTFRLCLGIKFPGFPGSFFPRPRLMVYRVASVPASSGLAAPASSGCPESCIYGWVNDDFPVILELCILGLPADESSWPIGRCIFLPYSGCTDNIIQA
jgi:hypothetical protein